ncbi:NAD-dependent epimerase/dehydratase family protein [Mycobacterium sp. URHB0044]|jgi:NAD(P)-dependent dehydrogenase (short-subunit alcohol dehydrogenase family)|uniref:NAD-dependent epimerase/dehydratase family protein n=1 Tax=Mycobacterium sp. URHB0044 TaxID=1380386 RepID=UPI000AC5C50D|nr:NAD-dependent epimerase/dehydratase family protein [Mycobacterium sp. URHB0044]
MTMKMSGTPDHSVILKPVPFERLDLSGERLAVIGGTGGLGRAIAEHALDKGAEVTVVGRTFRGAPSSRLTFVAADLSSMREAARLGRELPAESLDVALFTAGIMAAKSREETSEGIERDLAVSYLNRYAILQGLSSRIGTARPSGAPPARVFIMAAPGTGALGNPDDLNAEQKYGTLSAHMNTVAANEALILAGADILPGPDYFGLNPGLIKTDIRSNTLGAGSLSHRLTETVIGLFSQSPQQYAKRIVPLLFAKELDGRTGIHFNNKARPILPSAGMTGDFVDRFIAASDKLLQRAVS